MRGDLGTWDTSAGLVLGLLLLCMQFPLMHTSAVTLLVTLAIVAVIFAAFLLRASRGRRLPLVFLNAPIFAWSLFWTFESQPEMLAPGLTVAASTILVLVGAANLRPS